MANGILCAFKRRKFVPDRPLTVAGLFISKRLQNSQARPRLEDPNAKHELLIASSTSLTVAENSLATSINIPAPTDAGFFDSAALTVTVNSLPSDGTVVLSDGITPVVVGESLTVLQLSGMVKISMQR